MIDPQVVCLHSQGWIESSGKFTRTLQYYRLSNSTLPWVCHDNLWTSSKTSHLPLSGSRPDSQYINLASPPPSLLYLDKLSLVIGPALLTSFVEIFLVLFLTAEVGEILLGSPGRSDHLEPGAFARVTSARWLYLWSDTVKFFIIHTWSQLYSRLDNFQTFYPGSGGTGTHPEHWNIYLLWFWVVSYQSPSPLWCFWCRQYRC